MPILTSIEQRRDRSQQLGRTGAELSVAGKSARIIRTDFWAGLLLSSTLRMPGRLGSASKDPAPEMSETGPNRSLQDSVHRLGGPPNNEGKSWGTQLIAALRSRQLGQRGRAGPRRGLIYHSNRMRA